MVHLGGTSSFESFVEFQKKKLCEEKKKSRKFSKRTGFTKNQRSPATYHLPTDHFPNNLR